MAGDWLKIEKDTPQKPEMLALATLLNVSLADAFLACFKLWCWADSQTADGCAPRVTTASLDALCGLPGFADALREVGWLQVRDGSLAVPNFLRHMGHSAKQRALSAARMKRHRAPALQNSDAPSVTEPSPEKRERREEKRRARGKNPPGTPFVFVPPTVAEVAAYCRERGNGIDAEAFVAHYQSKGWKVGKTPMKDWKAAVITWEKNARRSANGQPSQAERVKASEAEFMERFPDP